MRVLVAGGTGVIGRAVVPLLEAVGHEVTALSRTGDPRGVLRGAAGEALLEFVLGAVGAPSGFFEMRPTGPAMP
jgi:uncharacterized protein YbjT (DUF2867 family)